MATSLPISPAHAKARTALAEDLLNALWKVMGDEARRDLASVETVAGMSAFNRAVAVSATGRPSRVPSDDTWAELCTKLEARIRAERREVTWPL